VKLRIYTKGSTSESAKEEHFIKDDIDVDQTGSFLCFETVTGKKLITNMDFIAIEEEDSERIP
jgi:hypothetical protein